MSERITDDSLQMLLEHSRELQKYKAIGSVEDFQNSLIHADCMEAKAICYEAELDEYKQAEAEGRLVVLPCKVGDTMYVIADCVDVIKSYDDDYFTGTGAIDCPFEKDCLLDVCDDENRGVFETECNGFWVDGDGRLSVFFDYINANIGPMAFGKTVFLTRKEAEAALAAEKESSHE